MTEHRHASHPAIVKRLKRAEGHLRSVVAMIEWPAPIGWSGFRLSA